MDAALNPFPFRSLLDKTNHRKMRIFARKTERTGETNPVYMIYRIGTSHTRGEGGPPLSTGN